MTTSSNFHPIIVTGTDTEIGKTVFAAALAGALNAQGNAYYWKPVQAGLEADGGDRDRVARLSGLAPERVLPDAYRLTTPAPRTSPPRSTA